MYISNIYIIFRSEDVVGTLKQAIKMNDPPLMVDLFGIVLETSRYIVVGCLICNI